MSENQGKAIYLAACKEAFDLKELSFNGGKDTFAIQDGSGPSSEKELMGGALRYQFFNYGELQLVIKYRRSNECPIMETYLKKGEQSFDIATWLTKPHWEQTSILDELEEAYKMLTIDFDDCVDSGDCHNLISKVREDHKDWFIEQIERALTGRFNQRKDVAENIEKQKIVDAEKAKLTSNYIALKSEYDEEWRALERSLRGLD